MADRMKMILRACLAAGIAAAAMVGIVACSSDDTTAPAHVADVDAYLETLPGLVPKMSYSNRVAEVVQKDTVGGQERQFRAHSSVAQLFDEAHKVAFCATSMKAWDNKENAHTVLLSSAQGSDLSGNSV